MIEAYAWICFGITVWANLAGGAQILQYIARPKYKFDCNKEYNVTSLMSQRYMYYDTAVPYLNATTHCKEEGALLMMIKDRAQERAIVYLRQELNLADDQDLWNGMRQTSHYNYTYADGTMMTLDDVTGIPVGGEWHRFYKYDDNDIDVDAMDSNHCIYQEGLGLLYSWHEDSCDATYPYICICQ